MKSEAQVQVARFNPRVCNYWLMSGAFAFVFSVVGIPLLLFWLPLGMLITQRQLASMECVLTNKALKIKKGIFVRIEKTVPLEKITDMGMIQGPLMRHFGIHTLTVETAGQSGPGALVSLTGILNAEDFRETVLAQRDALSDRSAPGLTSVPAQEAHAIAPSTDTAVLTEIRDALLRIEAKINNPA